MAETGPDPRPSWLVEACPGWCTREHREDDHPEDRVHQDDGIIVAGIIAGGVDERLHPVPLATEIIVRRSRPVGGQSTWVYVGQMDDTRNSMTLERHTAERLLDLRRTTGWAEVSEGVSTTGST